MQRVTKYSINKELYEGTKQETQSKSVKNEGYNVYSLHLKTRIIKTPARKAFDCAKEN